MFACLAALFVAAGFGAASAPAFADVTHPFLGSFGQGLLSLPGRAAVDQGSGDVYVVDSGASAVRVFGPTGAFLWETTGADTPAGSFFFATLGRSGVAVDGSGGLSDGDVYVADSRHNVVDVFDSTGAYERQLTGIDNPTGVAVDENGHLWVAEAGQLQADDQDHILEFDEAGNPIQNWPTSHTFTEALAVSSSHVYLMNGDFSISSFTLAGADETPIADFGTAVAVDPADDHLYVDQHDTISEYDETGSLVNQFASRLQLSGGIAVHGASGNVYVTNGFPGQGRVNVFGPLAAVPIVSLGPATSVGPTSATLTGTINPDGVASTYQFEWGADTNYGNFAPAEPVDAGDGTDDVEATADLTGLTPFTTYHYRLRGIGADGSTVTVDGEFTTPSPPAIVSVSGAGAFDTATLTALINPRGADTTFHFDYGLDANYGTSTTETPLGSGTDDLTAEESLAGLEPNRVYHFRVVATNDHGSTPSGDATFATTPAPSISTQAVTGIGQNGATISAVINPNGQETTYRFEYGLTSAYGSFTPASPASIGSGVTRQTVSAELTGLAPGTTYHYHVVASSPAGLSIGGDRRFTTQSPPCVGDACGGSQQPPPTGGAQLPGGGSGPPPEPPKTALRVGAISKKQRARWARTGTLALKVRVGGRGRVTARVLANLPGRFDASTVARDSKTARSAGVVTLRLRLSRAARAMLEEGDLPVRIVVSSTGANRTATLRLTLRQRGG